MLSLHVQNYVVTFVGLDKKKSMFPPYPNNELKVISFLDHGLKPFPDSKVHGANVGPIWGRQDPGGPHVGPMNFALWVTTLV